MVAATKKLTSTSKEKNNQRIRDSGKEYAKKTCNICGLRDIQPNMVRKEKKLKAKSKRGVTWNEILGTAVGSKTSARALKKSLYGPPQRNYSTKRTVWMCNPCARKN